MSAQNVALFKQATESLIAADAEFFLTLAFAPHLEPIRPTTSLMLMPFLSAFLEEAIDYAKRENPKALEGLRSRVGSRYASRTRIKLLDDNRPLEKLLAEADCVVATVKDMFMIEHRGFLGPFKRAVQTDLGIHFVRGEAVGTLHAALQNTGIPIDESRPCLGKSSAFA